MSRTLSSAAIAIAALTALAGCADGGDESLLILRNAVPNAGCELDPNTSRFISSGLIDTDAELGYIFTPIVESLVTEQMGAERTVFLSGANVDIRFQGDIFSDAELASLNEQAITSFSQSFASSLSPGDRIAVGFTIVPKRLLDEMAGKLAAGERTTVFADVSILGTVGGGAVESNTFTYPVDVCNGCTQNVIADCSALPAGFEAREGGTCQLLQDGIVDCCTSDGALICPAVASAPPEEPM